MIEKNQGHNDSNVYGYDWDRKNFVNWGSKDGKIVVESIENDDMETGHGSVRATRRDAEKIARQENALPNSQLLRAILANG